MNFGSSLQAVKSRIAEQVNRVRGASTDQSESDDPKSVSNDESLGVGQMALSAPRNKGGPLSTHVLDTSRGVPGVGVPVTLYIQDAAKEWRIVSSGQTNSDGRLDGFISDQEIPKGIYKLVFDTETYFDSINVTGFWPFVDVVFKVTDSSSHYHVPLVINPYGYSSYRGS